MNIDFHFYGTFTAALLAGYSKDEALTIAHAAQFVDESTQKKINEFGSSKFLETPTPTVQDPSMWDIMKNAFDKNWDNFHNEMWEVWPIFHFLPGNYGNDTYTFDPGLNDKIHTDKFGFYSWVKDPESVELFKLVTKPNSPTVVEMINDTINRFSSDLYMIGINMHVMADTWAHTYFSGINEWFLNDAYLSKGYKTKDAAEYNAVQNLSTPYFNSTQYLGHAMLVHMPDYPKEDYKFKIMWSKDELLKNNPAEFLNAFRQMVYAMTLIKTATPDKPVPFTADGYSTQDLQGLDVIISEILKSADDTTDAWKKFLSTFKPTGADDVVGAPVYDPNWSNKNYNISGYDLTYDSNYLNFNNAAFNHKDHMKNFLLTQGIYLNETPPEITVSVKLKAQDGRYIGDFQTDTLGWECPTLQNDAVTLNFIKATKDPLKSGDVAKIQVVGGKQNTSHGSYLGAFSLGVYYNYKDVDPSSQKWKISKSGGKDGDPIQVGDKVIIENLHYSNIKGKSILSYYVPLLSSTTYLTTINGAGAAPEKITWTLDSFSQQ